MNETIKDFEERTSYEVVYVTKSGSQLYGTNTETSDTDYKGIFIPTRNDVLLKRDMEHWNTSTGDRSSKNTSEDVDIELYSIYKFFNLLAKGETGAIDLYFSIFDSTTTIHVDQGFSRIMKLNKEALVSSKLEAFVGYCIGQSKKYNIKGERYFELDDFVEYMKRYDLALRSRKLGTIFKWIAMYINSNDYIKFVEAPGPRGSGDYKEITYIEVLGKKFSGDVTVEYFIEKITAMLNQFGDRAKASAKGVDYKALSHAVRVILEVEELLTTRHIEFPLRDCDYILHVKQGDEALEDTMQFISEKLDTVNHLMETTELPKKVDQGFIDDFILEYVK
jgi:hypothetical protein